MEPGAHETLRRAVLQRPAVATQGLVDRDAHVKISDLGNDAPGARGQQDVLGCGEMVGEGEKEGRLDGVGLRVRVKSTPRRKGSHLSSQGVQLGARF